MALPIIGQIISSRSTARLTSVALAAAVVLAGSAGLARPAAAAGDCTVTSAQAALDSEESALLATINQHRQANGRAALQSDATLNKAAAWMSADSARRGVSPSDHIDTLGRNVGPRLSDCGYTGTSKENVYWGQGTDGAGRDWASRASAFQFWSVESPAHNAAMLDPEMRYAGVARVCQDGKCHFTLDLGATAGVAQPPPPPPPGQPPAASVSWPTIRQGATGETVQSLQLLLGQAGQAVEVDGIFGPLTAQAVRSYQQAHNLSVDGIVGPQTWSALTVTVRNGSQGQAVRAVQRQLNAKGSNLNVDGIFGPLTDAAVRSYQQSHNLGVDGIVGPQTWSSLLSGR